MNLPILPAVLLVAFATSASATPKVGRYVRADSDEITSSSLRILEVRTGELVISLEAESHPDPSLNYARTGTLSREVVPVVGSTALYQEHVGEDLGCSIVFAFGAKSVQVSQFGQCAAFGAGIEVTGRYVRGR